MRSMQNSSRLPVHTRPNISIASGATLSIETGFQSPSTAFESSECHLTVNGQPAQPRSQCDNPTRILTVGVLTLPGSIRSNAGSDSSRNRPSAEAASRASRISSPKSTASPKTTTSTAARSPGLPQQIPSSKNSPDYAHVFLGHYTRGSPARPYPKVYYPAAETGEGSTPVQVGPPARPKNEGNCI